MKKKNKKTAPHGRSSTFRGKKNGVPNKKKKTSKRENRGRENAPLAW
jgi:hypothetical protein